MSDEQTQPQTEEVVTTFDVGNAEHVEKKKHRVKVGEHGANSAIRGIMSMPEGRAFFWWLLEQCHVHGNSFHQNGLTMAFNEGERNIGLKIEARLAEVTPKEFALMMIEAREKADA